MFFSSLLHIAGIWTRKLYAPIADSKDAFSTAERARAIHGVIAGTMQLISHAMLLWFAWTGSLGYIGMQLIFAAEISFINLLTIPLRAKGRIGDDVTIFVTILIVSLMFLVMVIMGFGVASAPTDHNAPGIGFKSLMALNLNDLWTALGYLGLRLLGIFITALVSGSPRDYWEEATSNVWQIGLATLFLMALLTFLFGGIIYLVHAAIPTFSLSAILATLAVTIHLILSLILTGK